MDIGKVSRCFNLLSIFVSNFYGGSHRQYSMNVNLFFQFRFQILRDLIPHSDQKRDTASFLLEVHHSI